MIQFTCDNPSCAITVQAHPKRCSPGYDAADGWLGHRSGPEANEEQFCGKKCLLAVHPGAFDGLLREIGLEKFKQFLEA